MPTNRERGGQQYEQDLEAVFSHHAIRRRKSTFSTRGGSCLPLIIAPDNGFDFSCEIGCTCLSLRCRAECWVRQHHDVMTVKSTTLRLAPLNSPAFRFMAL